MSVFAGTGCNAIRTHCAAAQNTLQLAIVKRPRDAEVCHLPVRPHRGLLSSVPFENRKNGQLASHGGIERTFARLGCNRRMAEDFERPIETATAMRVVGPVQLPAGRLADP